MNKFEVGKIYRSFTGEYEVEIKGDTSYTFYGANGNPIHITSYAVKEMHHIYGNTFVDYYNMTVHKFSNGVEFTEYDGDIIVASDTMSNKEIYDLYLESLGNCIERDEYANVMKRTLKI